MSFGARPLRIGTMNPVMLTNEQLDYEYKACDTIMRESVDWGPRMAEAEKRQNAIRVEMLRRRAA